MLRLFFIVVLLVVTIVVPLLIWGEPVCKVCTGAGLRRPAPRLRLCDYRRFGCRPDGAGDWPVQFFAGLALAARAYGAAAAAAWCTDK